MGVFGGAAREILSEVCGGVDGGLVEVNSCGLGISWQPVCEFPLLNAAEAGNVDGEGANFGGGDEISVGVVVGRCP